MKGQHTNTEEHDYLIQASPPHTQWGDTAVFALGELLSDALLSVWFGDGSSKELLKKKVAFFPLSSSKDRVALETFDWKATAWPWLCKPGGWGENSGKLVVL